MKGLKMEYRWEELEKGKLKRAALYTVKSRGRAAPFA
jgi:hypothetical protein